MCVKLVYTINLNESAKWNTLESADQRSIYIYKQIKDDTLP